MILNRPPQPPMRSMLFVPGNKPDWMRKAPGYGPDALIFDLEDSVPPDLKIGSRKTIRQAIDEMGNRARPRLLVRINALQTGMAGDDLEAIVAPGLFGVQVPKTDDADTVRTLDAVMSKLEQRAGLPVGQIFLMPLIESAQGVRNAYEIAMGASRVGYLNACSGGSVGDMALSVGYRETSFLETAYIFGKLVVDARAAGIAHPHSGLVTDPIHDLETVRARAERLRNFGYTGVSLIHPSHVELANEIYGPSKAEIVYWKGLVAAVEKAQREGTSAVVYEGKMMDIAHLNHAREMLKQTAAFPDLN
ncbi:MAG: CoA ester lyase [Betaproteobacteria bacterium]|nr:CoA ester lyase [Betaproteobacteria bacterium]